jgi:hypothetical protein
MAMHAASSFKPNMNTNTNASNSLLGKKSKSREKLQSSVNKGIPIKIKKSTYGANQDIKHEMSVKSEAYDQ